MASPQDRINAAIADTLEEVLCVLTASLPSPHAAGLSVAIDTHKRLRDLLSAAPAPPELAPTGKAVRDYKLTTEGGTVLKFRFYASPAGGDVVIARQGRIDVTVFSLSESDVCSLLTLMEKITQREGR